jgi:hypothetical protein
MTELYWISKTVIVDWPLKLADGVTPASTATVTGVVSKPDGSTAAMTITWDAVALVWRASYDPTVAGWFAFRLTATGSADSAEEGRFYVKASLLGGPAPTLDPTSDIGIVRLLITDVDEDNLLFDDAQITAFLTLEGGVKLGAAAALDAIARSEALVSKVIRTQDLATDGAKLATELRASASELRRQVKDGDADDDSGFVVVDFNPDAGWEAILTSGSP